MRTFLELNKCVKRISQVLSKRKETSLVVQWSESLTTNHEVPGSIPGSTVGIFLKGEDSRGDHGLGRLVEFRFKAPPGTTCSSITTHTPSGQRNCASWASQPQKSVTLLPCPGGRTTKSTRDMWWHWTKKIFCPGNVLFQSSARLSLITTRVFVFLCLSWQTWDTKLFRPLSLYLWLFPISTELIIVGFEPLYISN